MELFYVEGVKTVVNIQIFFYKFNAVINPCLQPRSRKNKTNENYIPQL